jgi:hypothetical protein
LLLIPPTALQSISKPRAARQAVRNSFACLSARAQDCDRNYLSASKRAQTAPRRRRCAPSSSRPSRGGQRCRRRPRWCQRRRPRSPPPRRRRRRRRPGCGDFRRRRSPRGLRSAAIWVGDDSDGGGLFLAPTAYCPSPLSLPIHGYFPSWKPSASLSARPIFSRRDVLRGQHPAMVSELQRCVGARRDGDSPRPPRRRAQDPATRPGPGWPPPPPPAPQSAAAAAVRRPGPHPGRHARAGRPGRTPPGCGARRRRRCRPSRRRPRWRLAMGGSGAPGRLPPRKRA